MYHQIRLLGQRHEIILCALNDGPIHPDAKKELLKYCTEFHVFQMNKMQIGLNLMRSLFNGLPMQVGYFWSPAIQQKIDALIKQTKPDRIFCQLIRTSEYAKMHSSIPKVLDYMDVFSKGIERRISKVSLIQRGIFRMEWKRLLRYESEIYPVFDQHCIISEQDRDLLPIDKSKNITIIPNGVDTDYFHPQESLKQTDILFNGNMNYPPNVESVIYLVKKILPLVHLKRPETNVLISGANPAPAVQALQSKHVRITGWVDDVRDNFAQSRMLVAPMQSSIGLQNKLLEAMAMRIPCITSSLSNNAIKAWPNEQILVADTTEDYAKHILFLLENPDKAQQIAQAGYNFVTANFGWENSVLQLEQLLLNSNAERLSKPNI